MLLKLNVVTVTINHMISSLSSFLFFSIKFRMKKRLESYTNLSITETTSSTDELKILYSYIVIFKLYSIYIFWHQLYLKPEITNYL